MKVFIIVILNVYMYGAMCLKYVSGAESLYQGISFMAYGKLTTLEDKFPGIYYICIVIFGALSIGFSFGDIENSKILQVVTSIMRVVFLILMYFGCCFYLVEDGIQKATPVWNFSEQRKHLATVFGNTVFVFIYHHSIPGIIYPIRPQSSVNKMFVISNVFGATLLFMEG